MKTLLKTIVTAFACNIMYWITGLMFWGIAADFIWTGIIVVVLGKYLEANGEI